MISQRTESSESKTSFPASLSRFYLVTLMDRVVMASGLCQLQPVQFTPWTCLWVLTLLDPGLYRRKLIAPSRLICTTPFQRHLSLTCSLWPKSSRLTLTVVEHFARSFRAEHRFLDVICSRFAERVRMSTDGVDIPLDRFQRWNWIIGLTSWTNVLYLICPKWSASPSPMEWMGPDGKAKRKPWPVID